MTFFRGKEHGDLPAYFHTNSITELHWVPFIKLLAKYIAMQDKLNEEELRNDFIHNPQNLRRNVLENLHITTSYFDARTKNYYNTGCTELFQLKKPCLNQTYKKTMNFVQKIV